MKNKVCIIGYGSIGQRHHTILQKFFTKNQIFIITQQKGIFNSLNEINDIIDLNPKYIFVCNETSKHYKTIKFIEKNLNNKIVLIEKPLFVKSKNLNLINNKYYVGYNMRFNPILNEVRKFIKNKKIYNININCGSYLPDWRKKRDYRKTYSASKKNGGGVLLDLSHEFDYVRWIFGDYRIKYASIKKISNLKIDSEDYADILLITKKNTNINISLNYFSRINKRELFINGEGFSMLVDLINKKITKSVKNKINTKLFKFDRNKSYSLQTRDLLNNKNTICKYSEAAKLMNSIDQMRKI